MTRAGEAAEGQKASSIVILILGLEGGFGTLWSGMSSLQLAVLAAMQDIEEVLELSNTEAGLESPASSADNSLS